MQLFNDTALFTSGTKGTVTFDLPDAELLLIDNFFSKDEADYYYEQMLHQTKWKAYEMTLFEKNVTAPRMIAWYEDKNNIDCNTEVPDWTPELLTIKKRVEEQTGVAFNSVLLNLYRDGNDGVAWHSDKEHNSGKNPTIASVTFGETRLFRLRHKFSKDQKQVKIPLHHGSFLLMSGTTNSFWQHQVPKTAREVLPRINLTFRQTNRNLQQSKM